MANLSSSNGIEKFPKLRFPEFKEPYRSARLGEIAVLINRTDPKSAAPIMMLSAGNGFIMQSDKYSRYNAGQSLKKYILLKKGELAYNHGASKAKQFGCCYELLEDEALIPYVYHCFKVDKNEYTPYVAFLLNNPKIDRQLKRLVSSSARMDGLLNISFKDYMSINLSLPPYAEQKQVSDFIKRIDERIVIQEQLISSLKKYKRGSLSVLFPKKREITPQYRFAGFTKPWEQRKLGNCAKFNPKSELPETFEYVDLESVVETDIISHRTEIKTSAPSRAQRLAKKGDVFYQTVRPYQKNNCIFEKTENNWVFSTGYAQLRPFNDSYFLLTLLQNDNFVKLVLDKCTGTSYPAINSNDLADIDVSIPIDSKEQQKIGTYFSNLDHLITLHQHKYDILLSLKNALLQQMFI